VVVLILETEFSFLGLWFSDWVKACLICARTKLLWYVSSLGGNVESYVAFDE